jgi:hypothetical protein
MRTVQPPEPGRPTPTSADPRAAGSDDWRGILWVLAFGLLIAAIFWLLR